MNDVATEKAVPDLRIRLVKNPSIDPINKLEREINGCKVRLFFCLERNERGERIVLDNLMLAFDRKISGLSSPQS